jgi:Holliday junction DNA helicase RuvA
MIASLTGRLVDKSPSHVILDVQGVGYEVFIPLSTFYALPELDDTTSLAVHTHLREDAIQLYGFLTASEKEAFLLLTGISGIGPKLGLSVLSTLSVSDLASAVLAGDIEKIATVPGVGKKSAGRIALELKDKVLRLPAASIRTAAGMTANHSQLELDALSALVNLGYRSTEVKDTIKRLAQEGEADLSLKEIIRVALKELAKG